MALVCGRARRIDGPNCGGRLKIIASIVESAVIERILTHLGLQARGASAGSGTRPCAARCVIAARRHRAVVTGCTWRGTSPRSRANHKGLPQPDTAFSPGSEPASASVLVGDPEAPTSSTAGRAYACYSA